MCSGGRGFGSAGLVATVLDPWNSNFAEDPVRVSISAENGTGVELDTLGTRRWRMWLGAELLSAVGRGLGVELETRR